MKSFGSCREPSSFYFMRKCQRCFESQVRDLALQSRVPGPWGWLVDIEKTAANRDIFKQIFIAHLRKLLCQPAPFVQQISQSTTMAPKAEKKPAKKVAKSTSSAAAKKRKLAKAETYKIYIYKVLKQARTREGCCEPMARCLLSLLSWFGLLGFSTAGCCAGFARFGGACACALPALSLCCLGIGLSCQGCTRCECNYGKLPLLCLQRLTFLQTPRRCTRTPASAPRPCRS